MAGVQKHILVLENELIQKVLKQGCHVWFRPVKHSSATQKHLSAL
jgi:hypothetical protein